ncbi:hypothetical protein [Actinopolyspora mortivallis]|uniref:hypothetical protein n=1 Tax=Actinopolyspora mortivallis TaxID=33906 RepID=UPI00215955E5|nr:hypothetical protein [Actinopolyspora mortivallis]
MATTYHHGQVHKLLAQAAGELLDRFTISTKVSSQARLPTLAEQAKRAAGDLGRAPAVILVHNPEHLLRDLDHDQACRWWTATAETMSGLVTSGMCRSWGVACWDPRPVRDLLGTPAWTQAPQPSVAMVRAGLLVPADVLTASEELLQRIPHTAGRWGMSPFAGAPHLLDDINLAPFLTEDAPQAAAPLPTALAVAFHLPGVSRIAIGTVSPTHLDQLATARTWPVNQQRLSAYRRKLMARAGSAR